MTETTKLVATIVATLVGSGLGTTIIGALFKKRFDTQLETHKALLQRSGNIHERQVDTLLLIHSKLEEPILLAASSGGREISERSIGPRVVEQDGSCTGSRIH
jgi:hypothetical protein